MSACVYVCVCVCVCPGGLGAMRRRLRRVVPPGVRRRVVRDGGERGLHLHGLLPEGDWRGRGDGGGGSGGGKRGVAGDVDVRRRRAEPALSGCNGRGVVVSRAIRHASKPSNFTSSSSSPSATAAAARTSAGQLASKKRGIKTEFEYRTSHNVHNTKPSIQDSVSTSRPARLSGI